MAFLVNFISLFSYFSQFLFWVHRVHTHIELFNFIAILKNKHEANCIFNDNSCTANGIICISHCNRLRDFLNTFEILINFFIYSVELPEDQRTCKENLGECMSWCNEKIRKPSTDCSADTYCCVLVWIPIDFCLLLLYVFFV